MPAVQELGKALSDPHLKGSTFVVAGHTDGVGGDASTRICRSAAPTPSSAIWSTNTVSPAATSSPSAMARPS